MPKIKEGVYFIPGKDEFLPDSHTYILGEPSSDDLSIVDIGLTGRGQYKMDSIRQLGIDPASIKRIIMTHTHMDHIGCINEFKKEMPHLELWVHRLEADLMEQGDERAVYGMQEFQGMCQMQYKLKPGDFSHKSDRKLDGGETLEIGNMIWEVINIPGHSLGGIGLYNPVHEILIPGDVIYADHAIGRFDLFGADGKKLRASLELLADMKVDILLPGHNQLMSNVPKDYIRQVLKMWGPYLG